MLKIPELEISQGEHLLINGKSGCGKSSLMNAAAGLFYYGSGNVFLPKDKAKTTLVNWISTMTASSISPR